MAEPAGLPKKQQAQKMPRQLRTSCLRLMSFWLATKIAARIPIPGMPNGMHSRIRAACSAPNWYERLRRGRLEAYADERIPGHYADSVHFAQETWRQQHIDMVRF